MILALVGIITLTKEHIKWLIVWENYIWLYPGTAKYIQFHKFPEFRKKSAVPGYRPTGSYIGSASKLESCNSRVLQFASFFSPFHWVTPIIPVEFPYFLSNREEIGSFKSYVGTKTYLLFLFVAPPYFQWMGDASSWKLPLSIYDGKNMNRKIKFGILSVSEKNRIK